MSRTLPTSTLPLTPTVIVNVSSASVEWEAVLVVTVDNVPASYESTVENLTWYESVAGVHRAKGSSWPHLEA